jgi:FkbM family methyltransferase
MSRVHRTDRALGLLRSLAIYHGVPGRARQLRRFYADWVPPGGLAFDIGAHAGNRVRAWRALGARVVAVEPQADFVRLLQQAFGRDALVTVLPQALGRSPGRAPLLVSPRTPTVSTLSPDWARRAGATPGFAGVQWQPAGEVEVTTLDTLIHTHGRPDFVKIDVEGFETEVLDGLSQPLPALSFELLPALRDLALACVDRLESLVSTAAPARYHYNFAVGERLRLVHDQDLDADALRAWIAGLPADAPSGDIYVRLARPDTA